ncbi:hypothetical protein G210_3959, partial [Candida maltosa Xu316]
MYVGLAEEAITDADYSREIDELIARLPVPKSTSKYRIVKETTDAITQDSRLTYGLVLNSIGSYEFGKSIPFHWADWVDLSLLNQQLNKPIDKRLTCQDMMKHVDFVTDDDRKQGEADPRYFGCVNSEDLTEQEVIETGYTSEELPGFIQFEHTTFASTEYIRNLQGKTYVMAQMPVPYQVIFINDHGDDLVFDVHKERINNLLEKYTGSSIDPVVEFEKLAPKMSELPYSPNPVIEMTPEMFEYTKDDLSAKIESMRNQPELLPAEQAFLNSMVLSMEDVVETPFFKEATLVIDQNNKDSGWHYDWRFFNGKLRDNARTATILERLLRNWFRFTEKYGIVSWIAHGPLLSWYWNGAVFPYDNDLDVQMSIHHLAKLGELFNNTLVVEDLREGMGKYLVEVGTFIHNREISQHGNHIDARFIDVDTGVYIDITGVSRSGHSKGVGRYDNRVFHDKRQHFYRLEDLVPLKLSMLNGVPCHVPNKIVENLNREYSGGIRRTRYHDYIFSQKLKIWIHIQVLAKFMDANDYLRSDGSINKLKMKKMVDDMTDAQVYEMLREDHELLLEYRLARSAREFHLEELRHLVRQ